MNLGLKGKIAAVAAASQGLGFAVARGLALEGAQVGICSRSQENIDRAAKRLRDETGTDVFTHVCDVSSSDEAGGFVTAVAEHFGGLDVLVTNAGGPPPGGFDDLEIDHVTRGFHVTLLSAITMMKTAIPMMQKQKWGRVVNILSLTAKQPELTLLTSNTMRAALLGFTKSVSQEVAKDNVLINNVCPGYTATERLDHLAQDLAQRQDTSAAKIYEGWESKIPMGRLGKPEELAQVVTFLASEPASYVTGVSIQVDGGFIKGLL